MQPRHDGRHVGVDGVGVRGGPAGLGHHDQLAVDTRSESVGQDVVRLLLGHLGRIGVVADPTGLQVADRRGEHDHDEHRCSGDHHRVLGHEPGQTDEQATGRGTGHLDRLTPTPREQPGSHRPAESGHQGDRGDHHDDHVEGSDETHLADERDSDYDQRHRRQADGYAGEHHRSPSGRERPRHRFFGGVTRCELAVCTGEYEQRVVHTHSEAEHRAERRTHGRNGEDVLEQRDQGASEHHADDCVDDREGSDEHRPEHQQQQHQRHGQAYLVRVVRQGGGRWIERVDEAAAELHVQPGVDGVLSGPHDLVEGVLR